MLLEIFRIFDVQRRPLLATREYSVVGRVGRMEKGCDAERRRVQPKPNNDQCAPVHGVRGVSRGQSHLALPCPMDGTAAIGVCVLQRFLLRVPHRSEHCPSGGVQRKQNDTKQDFTEKYCCATQQRQDAESVLVSRLCSYESRETIRARAMVGGGRIPVRENGTLRRPVHPSAKIGRAALLSIHVD